MKHEKKLKNLLAKMIGEFAFPEYTVSVFEEADIPTRERVEEFLPKIEKLFNN